MLHFLRAKHHTEVPDNQLPFKLSDSFLSNNQVVAVLSGATEGMFLDLLRNKQIDLKRPIYLLVTGYSNSLPAALEILSFIRQHNGIGKIMHHSKDTVFVDDSETMSLTRVPLEKVLKNSKKIRLGVLGKPQDWLIASKVDYSQVLKKMKIEFIDIPMEELTSIGEVDGGMKGAEAIYERIKEIVAKHKLDGITLRCFELIPICKNTACVALSKLNDEGIIANCESDLPVFLTRVICKNLTGEVGWMGSPSRVQPDGQVLLAKCTIPLSMTEKHEYTTHFESGIGVAIHGEVAPGDYTLVKLSNDIKRLLAVNVTVTRCQYEKNLCRTQIWVQTTPIVSQYLLTNPISNHHLLIKGHHAAKFWREA